MKSKAEAQKKSNDDSNNGKLLNEIETISKALYLDKNPSKIPSVLRNRPKLADKASSLVPDLKSKHGSNGPSVKDKKSFWNWKPLKALSHVKNRRFNCCFTLEVHAIEGLPFEFDGLCLCAHWKRRDGEVLTSPIKVIKGVATFEEKLTHTCSVYGSRNGPHHSAKYEAKHFLLYAVVHGNPKLDMGKHRVDLARLLPLTLEELEDEKSSGTWTTSFKLSGKAKGAVMNVSFGYQVLGDSFSSSSNKNVLQALESKSSARASAKYNLGDGKGSIRRAGSFPTVPKSSMISDSEEDVKVDEVLPAGVSEFSASVDLLYKKFDEQKSDFVDNKCEIDVSADADDAEPIKSPSCSPSHSSNSNMGNENEDTELLVVQKGKEYLEEKFGLNEDTSEVVDEPVVGTATLDVVCSGEDIQGRSFMADEIGIHDHSSKGEDICTKELLLEDLESVLSHVANLEKEALDTPVANSELSDHENKLEDKPNGLTPSVNLDDLADSVADDFLSMLGVEGPFSFIPDAEPESPRERLLREFQKEAEANGCSLFGFDIDEVDVRDCDDYAPIISGWEEFSEGSEFLPADEVEYPVIRAKEHLETQALATELDERSFCSSWDSDYMPVGELQDAKVRAKMMEDLETQALMDDWGLNEKAFQRSPLHNTGGFGSPIDLLPTEPPKLPPLAEGLGPIIQTESGGFLRSMNPVLFRNAKSGGNLMMQVSSPVVVPAELGSGVTEILQNLASAGLEKLSMQTKKLMPLEDITGKTMQQIAWERQNLLQDKKESSCIASTGNKSAKGATRGKSKKSSSSSVDDGDSEYVALGDLAPLAMDKIEALSIEGLRLQSGMLDEGEPSNISVQSIGEFSALEGKELCSSVSMGMEGAAGLQLLDIKDSSADDVDGLMGLSLTLDEWMRLDSGEIEEEEMSERTSKLLAAHHASCRDLDLLRNKGEKKQGKASGRRCGLLGNNFTFALMVQLRDPFRDFEPVGMPMLALIQVERVFVPPKSKIYGTVAETRDTDDGDDELESIAKEDTKVDQKEEKPQEQDLDPQYKISEVHVAGLKTEPGKKKLWSNAVQQHSGSRWLLANGMGKSGKQPIVKPKAASKSTLPATITSQPGDTLWSISSRFHGSRTKWK